VLLVGAEPHHLLHPGTGVPGAVEQDDLAGGGQMLEVALEVPLTLLRVGRLLERDDPCLPWVQMLHEPLDRPALAGGVAALIEDQRARAGGTDPFLQLEKLDLEKPLGHLVLVAVEPFGIRVTLAPRVDQRPVHRAENGVVVVEILDGEVADPVPVPKPRQLIVECAHPAALHVPAIVISRYPTFGSTRSPGPV